ncbi:MAG: ketoacid CoA transferase [Gammaproteobacteria bacterium]|nr:ketoacid CoA transferase [Gammaproteobacteria bacterium]
MAPPAITTAGYSLAELCIAACAEEWRGRGEILATGIGILPRLAVGLARLSFNPELLMTDGECLLLGEPVPLGPRRGPLVVEGWMPYARVFDLLWHGRRHALVTPVQMDRFGQMNISAIGDYARPKVAILGARGYPGNSISHANSMFVPNHSPRVFVAGEVDMVCSAGFNPARWPDGRVPEWLSIGRVITDLAVLDFGGPGHGARLCSLHPGVSVAEVTAATGFPLLVDGDPPQTPAPTAAQLTLIRERLDPAGLRATIFKGDPPGDHRAAPPAGA